MFRPIPLLSLVLLCTPALAVEVASSSAFGFSVGLLHPLDSSKVMVSQGGIYDGTQAGVTANDGGEFGLEYLVVHGERFSTRWGVTYAYQSMAASNPPAGTSGSGMTRTTLGGYLHANFILVEGVGKHWYLTIGGVYNSGTISQSGGSDGGTLDKVAQAGFAVGTGISFNGETMRFTPEFVLQKIGVETTAVMRLHCQVSFK